MKRRVTANECNTMTSAVTCTFLGHYDLYDWGLYPRILKAVESVVAEGSEIEFIFDRHSSFQFLSLVAILEVRQHNPAKRLYTTFISENNIDEQWQKSSSMWLEGLFPSCVFDKIILLPEKTSELKKLHFQWRRDKRDLINRSDFLICYEYPDLRDHYCDLYEYAIRQRRLTVLNVAKEETAQTIIKSMEELETKEQYIIRSVKDGKSYTALGAEFGVTCEAIRAKDYKARIKLRNFARARSKRERREHKMPPLTCAVVLPTKMDKVDEKRFRQVVHFLEMQMGVTTFLVEHLNCHSEFVDCLFRIRGVKRFRVELVTHYSDSVATTWGSTTEGFVPPFDGVDNIDLDGKTLKSRYHRALSSMLDRCEFAICKGTMDSDLTALRIVKKHRKLKVFDLGISQERVIVQNE